MQASRQLLYTSLQDIWQNELPTGLLKVPLMATAN